MDVLLKLTIDGPFVRLHTCCSFPTGSRFEIREVDPPGHVCSDVLSFVCFFFRSRFDPKLLRQNIVSGTQILERSVVDVQHQRQRGYMQQCATKSVFTLASWLLWLEPPALDSICLKVHLET